MASTRLGRLEQARSDQWFRRVKRALIAVNVVIAVLFILGIPLWYSAAIQARLRFLGPGDSAQLPWVRKQLQSSDEGIRSSAVCALGSIGTSDPADRDVLLNLLRTEHGNATIVHSVTWSLARLGKNDPAVTDALIGALEYPEPLARSGAAYALGQHGKSARRAVPALTRNLTDPHSGWAAAGALGNIGGAARESIPQLTLLVSNEDWAIRLNAVDALSKLGTLPDDTIEALQAHRDDPDSRVRQRVQTHLQTLGK